MSPTDYLSSAGSVVFTISNAMVMPGDYHLYVDLGQGNADSALPQIVDLSGLQARLFGRS
jgi:hypothetical protein